MPKVIYRLKPDRNRTETERCLSVISLVRLKGESYQAELSIKK